MKSPKKMKFSVGIDKTEAKGEHKFYLKFSKEYILNKNVLNVGSWTGPYEIIAQKYSKKWTSVDIEEKALKVLKKNIPSVNTVIAYSHELPFSVSSFDIITFWDVIEHIPNGYEFATIIEMRRVLKNGGYLLLATPHSNLLSKLFDPAYWIAGHRHYSDESLGNMLRDAGFEVEKIIHVGSFFSSFYALAFYFFKHILRRKMPNIKYVEDKMERDISGPGYIQVVIRAKLIKNRTR